MSPSGENKSRYFLRSSVMTPTTEVDTVNTDPVIPDPDPVSNGTEIGGDEMELSPEAKQQAWLNKLFQDMEQRAKSQLPIYGSLWNYIIPETNEHGPDPWTLDPAVPPPSVKFNVLSIVNTVRLGRKLNLQNIAEKGVNLAYNPKAFIPLKMYLKKPRCTALIFKSGSMIVNGTKTEADAKIATRRFARIIQKMGYRVSVAGMQIQNITCTTNLGFRVRLQDLGNCPMFLEKTYNPEIFNGVTVEMQSTSNRAKIMVFQSGRTLITGVSSMAEAHNALNYIYPFARLCAI